MRKTKSNITRTHDDGISRPADHLGQDSKTVGILVAGPLARRIVFFRVNLVDVEVENICSNNPRYMNSHLPVSLQKPFSTAQN
jgi:hypothetical protein